MHIVRGWPCLNNARLSQNAAGHAVGCIRPFVVRTNHDPPICWPPQSTYSITAPGWSGIGMVPTVGSNACFVVEPSDIDPEVDADEATRGVPGMGRDDEGNVRPCGGPVMSSM